MVFDYLNSRFPAIFFLLMLSLAGCAVRDSNPDNAFSKGTAQGLALAKKYCSTCHSFVPARMVESRIWKQNVLPNMGARLGISVFGESEYVNNRGNTGAAVSFDDWMKIVDYYTKTAPEKLTPAKPVEPVIRDWAVFKLKTPATNIYPSATTVLAKFDTATGALYTSDAGSYLLYRWDTALQVRDSFPLASPAVSVNFFSDPAGRRQGMFATLGTMEAKDISKGQLLRFDLSVKLGLPTDTLSELLPRPVFLTSADFNNNGNMEWIVCGFGHNTGGLYKITQTPAGVHMDTLLPLPGAIQAVTGDFNHDGWTDVMVLFAHDDESIRMFLNDRKGSFSSSTLLRFPPVFGSSSFQLTDINNDGLADIIYTCGDNADLTKILKPYHGMYIYINEGNFKYKQSYFYPINGCTKAVAADFDNDGDTDIATIAFFADFRNNPGEKFLYFEQDAALHFRIHSPPIDKYGRWICMDVNDYDKDGDMDIVLGNFSKSFMNDRLFRPNWNSSMPFIVLQNQSVKKVPARLP